MARGVHEPRRLTAVDGLGEGAVQEGVLDVELVNWPGASKGQREHRADGGRLHNRAEGLIVVDSGALSESSKDPASLVPLQGTIGLSLVRPDPLAGDDVGAGRTGHQIPCLVGDERRVLLLRPTPVGVQQGGADGGGYRRNLRVSGRGRQDSGRQGTSCVPRHHRVDVSRVAVKERWVVHRQLDTCRGWLRRRCRCPWRGLGHRRWRQRRRWRVEPRQRQSALVDPHRLGEASRRGWYRRPRRRCSPTTSLGPGAIGDGASRKGDTTVGDTTGSGQGTGPGVGPTGGERVPAERGRIGGSTTASVGKRVKRSRSGSEEGGVGVEE
jgi:hypothetical protein